MNAPFKPVAARDAFTAFSCDDETTDLLRAVAGELGWPIDKCYKGGLRNAVQSLSIAASPTVLFVDLSESGDPINDINALAEVCEPGTVVLAAGQINDVRLYRDLLASGIHDYLLKPLSLGQVREALASAHALLAAPRGGEAPDVRTHALVSVIGVRGGVGASTISSSLAHLLSSVHHRRTALLDLDVHFGTGALTFDLEPGRGLIDAIDNPSRIDGLFIERAMVRATERLSILSSEAPINNPVMSDGAAYAQLEVELKSAFDVTVVDLPRTLAVPMPHLLGETNHLVLVTDVTLAAARDTIRLLSWCKQNASSVPVTIVANKVQAANPELTRKDFEASIERAIDVVIPFDAKLTAQAAKIGKSYAEVLQGGKGRAPFDQLAGSVLALADGQGEPVPQDKPTSMLDRFKIVLPRPKPKA